MPQKTFEGTVCGVDLTTARQYSNSLWLMSDKYDKLEKLKKLWDQGIVTKE
jgi:hypothetical protein